MLKRLQIQNYAIIESLEVEFSDKLNIITGETGAGKSILTGALSLILGERADSSILLDKAKKCVVEASFQANGGKLIRNFMLKHELDGDDEILIRREISAIGKSRAFINDTPVTLSQLKELGSVLVNLHQQFDSLELHDYDFHREVIDALSDNTGRIQEYRHHFHQYINAQKELQELKDQQAESNKELDYIRFLYNELEEAHWKEEELEGLDAELKLLNNAENIKSSLDKIYFGLEGGEQPMVQQLKALIHQMNSLSTYVPAIPVLVQRLQSAQIELLDIAGEIELINDQVNFDPDRIQMLNERLSLGYKLLKKHGVQTTHELLEVQAGLEDKLNKVIHLDERIGKLQEEVDKHILAATEKASILTEFRKQQLQPFEENVNELLTKVGMPNAKIKVDMKPVALSEYGSDMIEFLFDANKSGRFEALSKVASGGELSRLMLSIKSLVARSIHLPTLIFDEIDTGISGEAARQVGMIMKELGRSHQVISITHQPQIAARADAHYFVYKIEAVGKIRTQIRLLTDGERVEAIAKMLSGERPSEAALQNAREMLKGTSLKTAKRS